MRKKILYGVLAILAVALVVEASQTPFPPWLQTYINQPLNTNGRNVTRIARATYDTSVHGATVGSHGLGITLPAKSIITRSYYHIDTQFTDSASSNAVWVFCEDLYNSVTDPSDLTATQNGGWNIAGHPVPGAPSTWPQAIANQCELTAAVASAALTAGKLTVYVEYVSHD